MSPDDQIRHAADMAASRPVGPARHHIAFCRLGLPLRAQRAAFRRGAGDTTLRLEPGAGELPLPAGPVLRLLLLHICDTALRSGAPLVELGEDAADLAARLGLPGKASAVAEQVERLLGCRLAVSVGSGPELSMIDARGRRRAAEPSWQGSLRLNRSFLGSLSDRAVELDAAVAARLAAAPLAFDAYAWAAQALAGADQARGEWEDLAEAFAAASQDAAAFREAFGAALEQAAQAGGGFAAATTEEGVRLRRAEAVPAPVQADAPPPPRQPAAPAATAHDLGPPEASRPAAAEVEPQPPAAPRARPQAPKPPRERPQDTAPATGSAPPAQEAALPDAPASPVPPEPTRLAPEPAPPRERPQPADAAPPTRERLPETISLRTQLTGLPLVIWLRQGYGPDSALVGVTPGERFDADRLTVLTVEPMVMQIQGGLGAREFERVSAWVMLNRDLIDDFWLGRFQSFEEVRGRVRKVPPGPQR